MTSDRRLSTSSEDSITTPPISAADSTSALILVHDEDNETPFDFSDEEDDDDDEPFSAQLSNFPALSSTQVFAHLLSPLLKLGTLLIPHTALPLKFGLPALFVFAVLAIFTRQLWYMLARYLRKADMEDVITDAFAGGRGKDRRRALLRYLVRLGTGTLRVLTAVLYLREATHTLLPLFTPKFGVSPQIILTLLLSAVFAPFYAAGSIASRRNVYAVWLSIATFVLWFILATIAYSRGALTVSPGWLRKGALWEGITTTAFAFSSSLTLPLYSALKGGFQPGTPKGHRYRSFRTLSLLSVAIATALMLPLVFFAASPNDPQELQLSPLDPYIYASSALTVLFAIPPILLTSPQIPIPSRIRRLTGIPLSKVLIFVIVIGLSLAPPSISGIFSDIVLSTTLLSTYFLPAFLHITMHFFKRPLSIVMPPSATPNPSAPERDELLQRKERALQQRQLRRRIIWDLGTWALLIPISGGGIVWATVKLAGGWY